MSRLKAFYDGYIVNAVIDAAYKSAKTKLWEKVELAGLAWKRKCDQTFELRLI
jgi:hypothetical protein